MSFALKTTTKINDAAGFIFSLISEQLKLNKKVLFFATGGSSVAVGARAAELLNALPDKSLLKNLTITLTDERYGEVGHKDSNWQQMLEKGFNIPEATLIPILIGENRMVTTLHFDAFLHQEFNLAKENVYRIGLFGVGKDGHTAGILPNSSAVDSPDLVFSYDTPDFSRITITPKVIKIR